MAKPPRRHPYPYTGKRKGKIEMVYDARDDQARRKAEPWNDLSVKKTHEEYERLQIRVFARLEIPCRMPDRFFSIASDLHALADTLILLARDNSMDDVRKAHFAQSEIRSVNRKWTEKYRNSE